MQSHLYDDIYRKSTPDVPLSMTGCSQIQTGLVSVTGLQAAQGSVLLQSCGNQWNGVRLMWLAHGWFDPSASERLLQGFDSS